MFYHFYLRFLEKLFRKVKKMNKMYSLPCLALAALLIAGCSDGSKDQVIATVGNQEITNSQFDAYLSFKNIPLTDQVRREKELTNYIEREALAQAITLQESVNSKEIEAEVREFKKQALLSRYFDAYLADQVQEAAIKNYYNSHIADYTQEKVHVAHILLRTHPKMSENEKAARLNKAHEAYNKLQKNAEFSAVAEQYSEDQLSAKKAGDLGWLKRGAIDANFSAKAFDLKPGEFSEPFATVYGYHIVKQLEEPKKIHQPYEKVKGKIRHILRQKAKDAEFQRLKSLVAVKKG